MHWLIGQTSRHAARYFITGIIAILPLAITVAVVTWVGGLFARFLGPDALLGQALQNLGLQFATNATVAYAIGAALMLAAVFGVGFVVEAGAKNFVQRLLDAVLQRIPVISNVYGTSKQLVGLLEKKEDANLKGMTAVFCFFGGKETGTGVLALLVSPERFLIDGREYQIVIIPTAPVPIGGGLFFVPAAIVQPANLSIEGLMSIYVSMGVSAPQFLPQTRPADTTVRI